MNRIKDYTCFATCFTGIGYIVLWPITAGEFGGAPLAASMLCHGDSAGWSGSLCDWAHPLRLPPGLHALGAISALLAAARLLVCLYKRSRRRASPAFASQVAQDAPPPAPRKPRAPLPWIKPRSQFGLRGVQR